MPQYNFTSAQLSTAVLTDVGMKLLQKDNKSKSNVIDVKAVKNSDSKKIKAEIAINRKAKQIMKQLLWEESLFEDGVSNLQLQQVKHWCK